jgi:hypothetical protein
MTNSTTDLFDTFVFSNKQITELQRRKKKTQNNNKNNNKNTSQQIQGRQTID